MRRLAHAAGDPHRAYPCSLIAGTNGKGSTAATLAAILHASGLRVGLYTSPHLVRINERWRIGGVDLSDAALEVSIEELRIAAARAQITPTYFEALTLLAFVAFRTAGCEHAVFEVGMGGRLDATNIVRPLVSLVTNVSLDHQEFLGSTLAKIAAEKAGIIHRGSVALTASEDETVLRVLRRRAGRLEVPLHVLGDEISIEARDVSAGLNRFRLITPSAAYDLQSPLPGTHQIGNISLAVRAAETLGRTHAVSPDDIRIGVAQTSWRGRAERFFVRGVELLVDGAHNAAGAEALASHVASSTTAPRTLVFAAMRDKEWRTMLIRIAPLFSRAVFTIADSDRGEDPRALATFAAGLGLVAHVRGDVGRAMELAVSRETPKSVVVAGSLYLAGAVLPWLDRRS